MDSPFQQYLGTNYVPTDEEIQHIRNEITSATREVSELDIKIDQLQKQLDIRHAKRSNIVDYVEQHQALISTARRLTDDVLACIFLACLPEDRNPSMFAEDAPSLLTRVCSSWRRVALSTPRLWAAFHVHIPSIKQQLYAVPHEEERRAEKAYYIHKKREILVNRWIELSGVFPLTISIYHIRDLYTADDETPPGKLLATLVESRMNFITDTILSCRYRWYSLDVQLSDYLLDHLLRAC